MPKTKNSNVHLSHREGLTQFADAAAKGKGLGAGGAKKRALKTHPQMGFQGRMLWSE